MDERPTLRGRLGALWQALLIGAIGTMLLVKVFSGALPLYVHVKYTPLIAGTGVVLIALGLLYAVYVLRGEVGEGLLWRSPAMLLLLIPILLGLAVPSRALGSAAIATRGFGNGGGMRSLGTEPELLEGVVADTSRWNMLDWYNALLYHPDNPSLQGGDIELTGFIWQRDVLPDDHVMVSRFVLSCCTADSLAIGLPVRWEGAEELANDSWVRVRGTVGLAEIDGEPTAVIIARELDPIPQPAEPYLYP